MQSVAEESIWPDFQIFSQYNIYSESICNYDCSEYTFAWTEISYNSRKLHYG